MDFKPVIQKLKETLYPKGRAFRTPLGGFKSRLHKALAISEDRAYNDVLSILDSLIPDNNNFTVEDATKWERRLGLITNSLTPFDDRKLAILRKMNHPGTIIARQHFLYLQGQLQAAGFTDVFVHENRFPLGGGLFETKSPAQILGTSGAAVHAPSVQHGQIQHGQAFDEKIANSIDPAIDDAFSVGNNFKSTFFLGGLVLGEFANVPFQREQEFRQQVLRIKPDQTIAFLFINFGFTGFNKVTSGSSGGDPKVTSGTGGGDQKVVS